MIEIAGEHADAAAAKRRPLVPIGARGRIELRPQPPVVGGDVGARVGAAEEAEEGLVVRQVLSRADLEPPERDMRSVEVDRGDAGRIGGQVGEHVAAARGDGDHLMPRPDVERGHVDDRVLPDLGIDEALERQREQALEHARARERLRAMDRSFEPRAGRATHRVRGLPHIDLRPADVGRSALDESRDDGVTATLGHPPPALAARGFNPPIRDRNIFRIGEALALW